MTLGVGAGSSLLSGLFGGKAAKKAAAQQGAALQAGITNTQGTVNAGEQEISGGLQNATGTLSNDVAQQLALLSPEISTGAGSTGALTALATSSGSPLSKQFSFNPTDLQSDPGYAFTLQQGQDAIQRAAASQGRLFSSGTLKSLANYTTGTANQYFNDAFNRAQQTFQTNRQGTLAQAGILQNLAGLGYGATAQGAGAIGQAGSQLAGEQVQVPQFGASLGLRGAEDVNALLTGKGNAAAAGTVGSTNSWLGALQGGTNSLISYLGNRNAWNPTFPGGVSIGSGGLGSGVPGTPSWIGNGY